MNMKCENCRRNIDMEERYRLDDVIVCEDCFKHNELSAKQEDDMLEAGRERDYEAKEEVSA